MRPVPVADVSFASFCALVETAVRGSLRRDLAAELCECRTLRQALARLREPMRSHVWRFGRTEVPLRRHVAAFDDRTRAEGFHVLHDWDGKSDSVNERTIALDVLDYVAAQRGDDPPNPAIPAILIDYYFVYLLALLSLRIWDEGDADANLDRLNAILAELQGPAGSGQCFAADVETLLLIGTAHFELDDSAYDAVLARTRTLNPLHQTSLAAIHAASLGGHLRFGFNATYGRDFRLMRDDNGVDYRWLLFALAALARDYERAAASGDPAARARAAEWLLGGLTADPRAFTVDPPSSLRACAAEREEMWETLRARRDDLTADFEPQRPSDRGYSPLALSFNFSHNVAKGIVVDALLWGEPCPLSLNDLLTGRGADGAAKERLARALMAYARSSPDTIRGRLMPVIVYDPREGREAFSYVMRAIKT